MPSVLYTAYNAGVYNDGVWDSGVASDDDRTLTVAAEDRTTVIAAEDRTRDPDYLSG